MITSVFVLAGSLVGNVADMSARVVATPTMSAENGRHHNVADVMTGFGVESRVGCTNGYLIPPCCIRPVISVLYDKHSNIKFNFMGRD